MSTFAVVASRATPTNTRLGVLLSPAQAVARLRPGDVALGRLDVLPSLDGIEPGLWALDLLDARGVTVLNGRDVIRCDTPFDLEQALEEARLRVWFNATGGVLQRLIPPAGYDLRVAAAEALGGDLVGVDLLPLPGGSWMVLEINGAVDFTAPYSLDGEIFSTVRSSLLRGTWQPTLPSYSFSA